MGIKRIRKAVIPVAGYGTRFLPVTKATPKEMLPVVDKPVIQYIVEEALESGIEEILLITGHTKRAIEDHFDSSPALEMELEKKHKDDLLQLVRETAGINIHYIRQKRMLGLGDAILCAKSFVGNEPFAVLLGNDMVYNPECPALRQLMDVYELYEGTLLGCQLVPEDKVSSYVIVAGELVDRNGLLRVNRMIEKPEPADSPSRMAVLGRYIIEPGIFEILEHTQPGKGNEVQITNALYELTKCSDVYAYAFEGIWYDVGNKLGFLQATVEYALRRNDLGNSFKEYLKKMIKEI